jgi:quercetin dioxygenase-like cupin family protein
MMATELNQENHTRTGVLVRKAADHRVQMAHQPGQAHRSAAGWTIDYRLQEITGDAARAISSVEDQFVDKPAFGSPWHYHDCDLQVAFVLQGSIELGYQGDTYARAGKGDILFIPGHVMHDVSNPSADYQVAEITFPGSFGTTEAAMPARDIETPARTWGSSDAVRAGSARGIIDYGYPVAAPYDAQFDIRRQVRSRTEPFEAGTSRHDDRYRFIFVMQGWRAAEIDGAEVRAGVGDLIVIPGNADWRDSDVSDDYEAVEVRLRA